MKKFIRDERWDLTGVSNHANHCNAGFDWNNVKTFNVEETEGMRYIGDPWSESRWCTLCGDKINLESLSFSMSYIIRKNSDNVCKQNTDIIRRIFNIETKSKKWP